MGNQISGSGSTIQNFWVPAPQPWLEPTWVLKMNNIVFTNAIPFVLFVYFL